MTNEEKIAEIKDLLSKYVAERVKAMADGAALRAVDVDSAWDGFVQKWFENYKGEEKVPHYIVRELIKHIETITKPYNVPYVKEIIVDDWAGNAPNFTITIPATIHNLLGCIEVNAYSGTDSGYDLIEVGLSVDFNKNITVKSSTRFAGKIEAFSSVGETPELQHRQPVYTIKGFAPDETGEMGGITEEMLFEELAAKINNVTEEMLSQTLAARINNVLFKDNTTAYTPTSAYHPATKEYVDKRINVDGGINLEDYYTKAQTDEALGDYYTKAQKDEAIGNSVTRWNDGI